MSVARRPVVALISTGDELVMPGETPGPDQIIASNTMGLHALMRDLGAEPRLLPIARDNEASLRTAVRSRYVRPSAKDVLTWKPPSETRAYSRASGPG